MRARLRRVDWDRLMGLTSLVCAVIMAVSWIINPTTIP